MFKDLFISNINEIFNEIYQYKKTAEDSYTFYTAKGDKIEVIFSGMEAPPFLDYGVEISFARNNLTKLNNEGDAFKILGTVLDIIKKEKNKLKEYDPVYFTAKKSESGRVKLYNIFSKKLQKMLNKKYMHIITYNRYNKEIFYIASDNDYNTNKEFLENTF